MAITRWEPLREMARLQDEFNRFFDDRLFRWRSPKGEEELGAAFAPAVDIYEDNELLVLSAELPGIDPKDVDIRIENGALTIKGERKVEREDKKENYLRVERSYGSFSRSFSLPNTADTDKVKAEFKNGVLKILIPRREEARPKAIKVKVD